MTFKETFKTLNKSKEFKKFIKENPSAVFCAGFFVLDLDTKDTKKSLDYLIKDKVYTFDIKEDEIIMKEDKLLERSDSKFQKLEKISSDIKIELDELKGIAGIRALDEGIHSKFQKIIAVLQKMQDKVVWNLTCMLEGLVILNVIIDSDTGDIIKFEKRSLMEFVKK